MTSEFNIDRVVSISALICTAMGLALSIWNKHIDNEAPARRSAATVAMTSTVLAVAFLCLLALGVWLFKSGEYGWSLLVTFIAFLGYWIKFFVRSGAPSRGETLMVVLTSSFLVFLTLSSMLMKLMQSVLAK